MPAPQATQMKMLAKVKFASKALKVRSLKMLGSATSTTVSDAGNANPDSGFRYDSTIGGSGGYIFNLSTKNLQPGRYGLAFSASNDPGFLYSLVFEVK